MQSKKYRWILVKLTAVLLLSLTGCREQRVAYFRHQPMATDGWSRYDTVTFDIPGMADAGRYETDVALRIHHEFPFASLTLIVQQTILPSQQTFRDTILCQLIDQDGQPVNQGVSKFQYLFPLNTLTLQEGDRLQVRIWHAMRREDMEGISDVGFRLHQ